MNVRLTILWIWKICDPLFYLCTRLNYVRPSEATKSKSKSIFRVRITKYKGKEMILSDGTRICKNDLLLKIHLHNVRLLTEFLKLNNDVCRARKVYHTVYHSMTPLAFYMKAHPQERRIKGVIGITTINKGALLGFDCFFPTNSFYKWFKKMGQLPISLLSNSTFKSFKKHKLTYLIMSKEKLYSKYIKEDPL
ncbi:hypothetical protein [Neobacillus sp. PS3-40]|uniref:YkoP family protein n=1 Tax=Neobacillus sp. PS3-40 TaxID=3070679 RepID=UPI0027E09811|nr:hypothetical protein [Neobacillus sp. PS3-40]WML44772.1 hypothetical protein RCG20_02370 [Neobacillus sp. PS3-40]